MQAVELSHEGAIDYKGTKVKSSIIQLCKKVDMSRQSYYKARKSRQRKEVDESLVIKLAKVERQIQSRLGGKKLYHFLRAELESFDLNLGRDRFLEIIYSNGLKLDKLPKSPCTTDSYHSLGVFLNEVKAMEITAPNQAWASDITYIRVNDEFMYLSLITDMCSRRIVGYNLSHDMKTTDCLVALEMALSSLPQGAKPVHHSDRGSQYCSHAYTEKLKAHDMKISMTETNHCAENAMAERVNGILKQEYYLKGVFKDEQSAKKSVEQAIYLYNIRRPHLSLNYQTPNQVHFKAEKNAA